MKYTIHSKDTASDAAKPLIQKSLDTYKFLPNLHGVMAEAPLLLEAYQTLSALWATTSLSVLERQIVLLTINRENGCHYCMAAHSTIATMEKMPEPILAALRSGEALPDAKLEALRSFTIKMVQARGWVDEADHKALLDAGYTQQTILEVILAVGYKVLSNYTNHVAQTPVDEPFQKFEWSGDQPKAAE